MSIIYAHADRDVYFCASCLINHENVNTQSVKDPIMLKIYAPSIYSMLAQITTYSRCLSSDAVVAFVKSVSVILLTDWKM